MQKAFCGGAHKDVRQRRLKTVIYGFAARQD
jgi:hypothetical protein